MATCTSHESEPSAAVSEDSVEPEFLEPASVLQDFECPLCLQVTREPSLTSCCGQHFCQSCIQTVVEERDPCPYCKEQDFQVFLDKKQKRRVSELRVGCTLREIGCEWVGELGDLARHVDRERGTCGYVELTCSQCNWAVQRRFVEAHITEYCPLREFVCEYCGYQGTFEEVSNQHWLECTKFPIPCPNSCRDEPMERGEVPVHLQTCPLHTIDCPFTHSGCEWSSIRRDLQKHMDEKVVEHLQSLSSFGLVLQQQLHQTQGQVVSVRKEKEEQIAELREEIAKSRKEVRSLRKRVSNIETALLLPPVLYTQHQFSHHKAKGRNWQDGPIFYSHLNGCKLTTRLFYGQENVYIELWQLPGQFDSTIVWPLKIEVFAQIRSQGNGERCVEGRMESELQPCVAEYRVGNVVIVKYSELEGDDVAQYVKNDCLQIRIDAKYVKQ